MNTTAIRLGLLALVLTGSEAFAQRKIDGINGMDMGKKPVPVSQVTHAAKATVKKVDAKAGTVTLAHGPVASLNWPSMTMNFKVNDRMLLQRLGDGKRVDVEFAQEGADYVVKSVK